MKENDEKYAINELHYLVQSGSTARNMLVQYSANGLISNAEKQTLIQQLDAIISKWHYKINQDIKIYKQLRKGRMNIFTEIFTNLNNTFLRAKLLQIELAIRDLPKPPRAVRLVQRDSKIIRVDEIFHPYSKQDEAKWKTVLKNDQQSDFLLFGLASDSLTHHIYVANSSEISIIVLNDEGNFIKGFHTIPSPYYICIHKDYIYASCLSGIIVKADKTSGSIISSITLFLPKTPAGLTFDRHNNLYLCDNNHGNIIKVFDENFYLQRDIVLKDRDYGFHMIWSDDIRVFQDHLYMLYSKSAHPVKVYNLDGDFLRCVVYREKSYLDKYFALDEVGNIIVSVCGVGCIKVYSNSGAQLHTITDLNRLNGGIAINNNFNLYICLGINKHFNAILSLN